MVTSMRVNGLMVECMDMARTDTQKETCTKENGGMIKDMEKEQLYTSVLKVNLSSNSKEIGSMVRRRHTLMIKLITLSIVFYVPGTLLIYMKQPIYELLRVLGR